MDDSGPVGVCFIGNEAALVYSNGITVIGKESGFGVHFFTSEQIRGRTVICCQRKLLLMQVEELAGPLGFIIHLIPDFS